MCFGFIWGPKKANKAVGTQTVWCTVHSAITHSSRVKSNSRWQHPTRWATAFANMPAGYSLRALSRMREYMETEGIPLSHEAAHGKLFNKEL